MVSKGNTKIAYIKFMEVVQVDNVLKDLQSQYLMLICVDSLVSTPRRFNQAPRCLFSKVLDCSNTLLS